MIWRHRWVRVPMMSAAALVTAIVAVVCGYVVTTKIPELPVQPQASTLYFADGKSVLARVGIVNRTDVSLDRIPKSLRDAVVAAEDRDFYDHAGVSVRGMTALRS
ncbi:transglycosylase domain-containing protein [Dactylosporangium sp. NPDC000555]|uniref:transglycosylase domain-containing protein n=1 Tax=Dactylosporangium sp. NPDC000555 TaxID=3154260 RepID=UPI0033337759